MVREPGRVGRADRPYSKDATGLGKVVGIECCSAEGLVAVEGRSRGERGRRPCTYGTVVTVLAAEYGEFLCSGEVHGREQDADNKLFETRSVSFTEIPFVHFAGMEWICHIRQAQPSLACAKRKGASHCLASRWQPFSTASDFLREFRVRVKVGQSAGGDGNRRGRKLRKKKQRGPSQVEHARCNQKGAAGSWLVLSWTGFIHHKGASMASSLAVQDVCPRCMKVSCALSRGLWSFYQL